MFPLAYLQSLISVVISYFNVLLAKMKFFILALWILSLRNTHCQVITLNGAWRGIINICGKYYKIFFFFVKTFIQLCIKNVHTTHIHMYRKIYFNFPKNISKNIEDMKKHFR